MFKNLVVAIVGGLVIWFVQDYFRDVPKASFSVSNPIEIPGLSGKIEYAQEVSITNTGRTNVKDVSVRAPFSVSSYKLSKHSSLVKEGLGTDPNKFELIYPELPVGQRFNLLLRYSGNPIDKKLIGVNHDSGAGSNQEDNSGGFSFIWVWSAFILGWVLQSISDLRRIKRDAFVAWANEATIYQDNKPWFFSSKEWPVAQVNAIMKAINGHEYAKIQESKSFKLLNKSKPALLNSEHWADLISEASKNVIAKFSKELTVYASIDQLLDLSRVEKPHLLSIKSWNEINKSLNNCIYGKLLPSHTQEKELVDILENASPKFQGVPLEVMNQVRKSAGEQYYFCLLSRCHSFDGPYLRNFLNFARLDFLSENQRTELVDLVDRINHFDGEIKAVEIERDKLFSSQSKVDALINRVSGQLDVIDRVLSHPDTIERIEDYDQTFAPGNWTNLRKVATILGSNS